MLIIGIIYYYSGLAALLAYFICLIPKDLGILLSLGLDMQLAVFPACPNRPQARTALVDTDRFAYRLSRTHFLS